MTPVLRVNHQRGSGLPRQGAEMAASLAKSEDLSVERSGQAAFDARNRVGNAMVMNTPSTTLLRLLLLALPAPQAAVI